MSRAHYIYVYLPLRIVTSTKRYHSPLLIYISKLYARGISSFSFVAKLSPHPAEWRPKLTSQFVPIRGPLSAQKSSTSSRRNPRIPLVVSALSRTLISPLLRSKLTMPDNLISPMPLHGDGATRRGHEKLHRDANFSGR